MHLLITKSVKKQLKKCDIDYANFILFLKNNLHKKTPKIIPLYTHKKYQIIYKCYLSSHNRGIILIHTDNDVCYPVYIGNKKDLMTKNITVAHAKKYMSRRLERFEREVDTLLFDLIDI